jgi:peptidoglycan/xylan/chitin deacetylase (PgdA/CDA1 family)
LAPQGEEGLAMNFRNVFKAATAAALVGMYLRIRRRRSAKGGALIHVLGYHRVVDRIVENGPISPSLCVSTETFRRQMEQVKRNFRVLSLEDALRAIDGDLRLDRDACAVTFDDGYRDVYTRAAPILAELGIPATVFVPSGYVGSARRFTHDRLYAALWQLGRTRLPGNPAELVDALIARLPASDLSDLANQLEARSGVKVDDDARVLDPAELKSLAQKGWEIGSHTIDHTVLTHEPPEKVTDQLLLPKIDLESITGRPCRYFAYCNGLHSPQLVAALEHCGYQGAVTTRDRPNRRGGDRFRVSRKVLWEGHARGVDGKWSPRVSAANLHDLFGALGLTRPIDGEVACVA